MAAHIPGINDPKNNSKPQERETVNTPRSETNQQSSGSGFGIGGFDLNSLIGTLPGRSLARSSGNVIERFEKAFAEWLKQIAPDNVEMKIHTFDVGSNPNIAIPMAIITLKDLSNDGEIKKDPKVMNAYKETVAYFLLILEAGVDKITPKTFKDYRDGRGGYNGQGTEVIRVASDGYHADVAHYLGDKMRQAYPNDRLVYSGGWAIEREVNFSMPTEENNNGGKMIVIMNNVLMAMSTRLMRACADANINFSRVAKSNQFRLDIDAKPTGSQVDPLGAPAGKDWQITLSVDNQQQRNRDDIRLDTENSLVLANIGGTVTLDHLLKPIPDDDPVGNRRYGEVRGYGYAESPLKTLRLRTIVTSIDTPFYGDIGFTLFSLMMSNKLLINDFWKSVFTKKSFDKGFDPRSLSWLGLMLPLTESDPRVYNSIVFKIFNTWRQRGLDVPFPSEVFSGKAIDTKKNSIGEQELSNILEQAVLSGQLVNSFAFASFGKSSWQDSVFFKSTEADGDEARREIIHAANVFTDGCFERATKEIKGDMADPFKIVPFINDNNLIHFGTYAKPNGERGNLQELDLCGYASIIADAVKDPGEAFNRIMLYALTYNVNHSSVDKRLEERMRLLREVVSDVRVTHRGGLVVVNPEFNAIWNRAQDMMGMSIIISNYREGNLARMVDGYNLNHYALRLSNQHIQPGMSNSMGASLGLPI